MTVFYCFDVDGTLSTSSGPVPVEKLYQLKKRGNPVIIVSPSSARPMDLGPVPTVDRFIMMREIRTAFPDADAYLYVSNNQDMAQAKEAGFTYVEAANFV